MDSLMEEGEWSYRLEKTIVALHKVLMEIRDWEGYSYSVLVDPILDQHKECIAQVLQNETTEKGIVNG